MIGYLFSRADHVGWSLQVDAVMQHRGDACLLDRAVRALFSGAPSALLAAEMSVPKATARSWRRHRRAPMPVYRRIHRLLQERAAECYDLWRLLGIEIAKREGEPPRRRGFFVIDPLTGQNRQNRRGRPRRALG